MSFLNNNIGPDWQFEMSWSISNNNTGIDWQFPDPLEFSQGQYWSWLTISWSHGVFTRTILALNWQFPDPLEFSQWQYWPSAWPTISSILYRFHKDNIGPRLDISLFSPFPWSSICSIVTSMFICPLLD